MGILKVIKNLEIFDVTQVKYYLLLEACEESLLLDLFHQAPPQRHKSQDLDHLEVAYIGQMLDRFHQNLLTHCTDTRLNEPEKVMEYIIK